MADFKMNTGEVLVAGFNAMQYALRVIGIREKQKIQSFSDKQQYICL